MGACSEVVIDTRTGQPYPERSLRYQENWEWTDGKSVDEIAGYMRYGLQILKNVGLPCEGITTPGGFGNQVRTPRQLILAPFTTASKQSNINDILVVYAGGGGGGGGGGSSGGVVRLRNTTSPTGAARSPA